MRSVSQDKRIGFKKVVFLAVAFVFAILVSIHLYSVFTSGSVVFRFPGNKSGYFVALKVKGTVTDLQSHKGEDISFRTKPVSLGYAVSSAGYISTFGSVRIRSHARSVIKVTLSKQPRPRSIPGPASARFPIVLPGGSTALCWSGNDLVKVSLTDGAHSVVRHLPFVQGCSWAYSGNAAIITLTNDRAMASTTPGALYDPSAGPTSTWVFSPSMGVLGELPSGLFDSSISTDGTVIAYTVQSGDHPSLVIRRGTAETAFTLPAACRTPDVSLSPSGGEAIVYSRPGDDIRGTDLYSIDTSSGTYARLTSCGYISSASFDDSGNVFFQRWDKDGKSSLIWYMPAGSRDAFSTGFSANLSKCSFTPGGVLVAPCSSGEAGSSGNSYSLVYSVPAAKISSFLIDSLPDNCCFMGARGKTAVLILGDSQNSWYVFDYDPALLTPEKGGIS